MRTEVIIVCLIVGCANYLFRYLPLRLHTNNRTTTRRGLSGALLDSIGVASICALLVVSSVPDITHDNQRLIPTLAGFVVLIISFFRLRSIIIPTLLGALCYGLVWKLMLMV